MDQLTAAIVELKQSVDQLRTQLTQGGDQLAVLDSIANLMRLNFLIDMRTYLSAKVRAGEAYTDKGAYYQLIAPGGTFDLQVANPEGFVWIGHQEMIAVSQGGVIQLTVYRDDPGQVNPFYFDPALVDFNINWTQTVPYAAVNKDGGEIIYVNNDAVAQWVHGSWIGTFIRKDVWEAESKLIAQAANLYKIGGAL